MEEILTQAKMSDCNPSSTPVDKSSKLSSTSNLPVEDPTLFRSLDGALQYLTFTLPNICNAVQKFCFFMHDPRAPYFAAFKRVLRYIKGILDHGLTLIASSDLSPTPYLDAN